MFSDPKDYLQKDTLLKMTKMIAFLILSSVCIGFAAGNSFSFSSEITVAKEVIGEIHVLVNDKYDAVISDYAGAGKELPLRQNEVITGLANLPISGDQIKTVKVYWSSSRDWDVEMSVHYVRFADVSVQKVFVFCNENKDETLLIMNRAQFKKCREQDI